MSMASDSKTLINLQLWVTNNMVTGKRTISSTSPKWCHQCTMFKAATVTTWCTKVFLFHRKSAASDPIRRATSPSARELRIEMLNKTMPRWLVPTMVWWGQTSPQFEEMHRWWCHQIWCLSARDLWWLPTSSQWRMLLWHLSATKP